MEQKMEREIQVDVMLSTTDQRDFVSFYSFEKNPRQKFLFLAALFVGFVIILLRDTTFPIELSFTMGIIMIVLLSFIWRQRSKASHIAQGPWIVKNRLTLVTLGEDGVVEIDPSQSEEEEEYDFDDDDEDYCDDEDENCVCEDEEADEDETDDEEGEVEEAEEADDEEADADEGEVEEADADEGEAEEADADEGEAEEDGGEDDGGCQRGDSHDDDGDVETQDGTAHYENALCGEGKTDNAFLKKVGVDAFIKGQADSDSAAAEEDRQSAGKIVRSGRWREFPGAYENSRYFYVFLNDVEAFILQKNRMKESLVPEIRAFLAEKMGDRFRAVK